MDTPPISPHIKAMLNDHNLVRRTMAEAVGTFWLVLGGCGSAVLAAGPRGIGLVGVALAFGLTVLTMAYALGHASGARRFPSRAPVPYIVSQLVGAVAGSGVVLLIAGGGYTLGASLLTELALTAAFLIVIVGATDERAPPGLAPLAIGLALTLIHLISIPVTNTAVDPARSTSLTLFVGGWAARQLWLFWLAPLLGGAIYGVFRAPSPAARPEHVRLTTRTERHA